MATETIKPADTPSPVTADQAAPAASKPSTSSKALKPRTRTTTKTAAKKPAPKAAPAGKKVVKKPATKTSSKAKKAVPKAAAGEARKKADKPEKTKKVKLVRDSFTMPEGEYSQIAALKKRCLKAGVSAKKSEILRAAILNLAKLSDASLTATVRKLDVIKTGRPAKGSK